MKRLSCYILLSILSFFAYTQAQQAIGSWQSYLSYHNATMVEPAGNLIYAVGNGGLFSFDKDDESVRTYWKNNLLNDTDITHIRYHKATNTLLIVYSNFNIDILINDESVFNLSDYKDKNVAYSKKINNITLHDNNAYLSTAFGIIVIDLKRKEISNSYNLHVNVNDCAIYNNVLYAATSNGLYTGLLSDNLLDINNWKMVSDVVYSHLVNFNNALIGNVPQNGINLINTNDNTNRLLISGHYPFITLGDNKMLAYNSNSIAIFDSIEQFKYINIGFDINQLQLSGGTFWFAHTQKGLMAYKLNDTDNTFKVVVSSIVPNSPIRNLPHYIYINGDKILITCGAKHGEERKGTIMQFQNNEWTYFQEENIEQTTGVPYINISCIVQDPRDEKHHFASSFGEGLYEFHDGKFKKRYSMDNSPLESALPDDQAAHRYVKINGLNYDKNNNLWMLNATKNHPIHVLKSDNTWKSLSYSSLKNPINFKSSIFDRNGNFWAISSHAYDNGVFCLNYNGTIDNVADDKHKFIGSFTNQDGTLLTHKGMNCIVEDHDGTIWVGTGQGPIVLNNPTRFFMDGYNCTQIKVPRNDGTNLADFLLVNEQINDIAIDGGNRKWMGTESNGLYLVSPDGLETIHHFTEDNSPLPCNTITSIAIHPKTGVVYIGTLKGLVTYKSEATEGEDRFEEDNVYAYPNPVHPDYNGTIIVTGLMRDSDVKITNISGKLIYEGSSLGGQFSWDGRNMQGHKVVSGVYFVLAANKDGKEGIVTKILFVK